MTTPSTVASKHAHLMGRSTLNHGTKQCVKCRATDLEIYYAIGPVCPGALLQRKDEANG